MPILLEIAQPGHLPTLLSIVGTGNSSTRSNGLTVFNNGGVSIGSYANSTVAPANGEIVSGNIGIGIATPHGALQVVGQALLGLQSISPSALDGNDNMYFEDTSGAGWTELQMYNANDGTSHNINAYLSMNKNGNQAFYLSGNSTPGLNLWTRSSHPIRLGTNNTEWVYLGTNGHLGIDTSSPTATLTVNGGIQINSGGSNATLIATDSTGTALQFGINANTSANNSLALGTNVTSKAWSAVTLGHYNTAITGNTTTWVATDPALIVGTGNSTTSANGLVVQNNGNTTINGSSSTDIILDPSDQKIIFSDGLTLTDPGNIAVFNSNGNTSNISIDPDNQQIRFSSGLTIYGNTGQFDHFCR